MKLLLARSTCESTANGPMLLIRATTGTDPEAYKRNYHKASKNKNGWYICIKRLYICSNEICSIQKHPAIYHERRRHVGNNQSSDLMQSSVCSSESPLHACNTCNMLTQLHEQPDPQFKMCCSHLHIKACSEMRITCQLVVSKT